MPEEWGFHVHVNVAPLKPVYILDDDGLENFRNGNETPTYYNSGSVTVGSINKVLAPGRYHIVFSNRYAFFTNKAVLAQIELQY